MALTPTVLKRKFSFTSNGQKIELADIPNTTPNQVLEFYSGAYPELTNGTATYKGIENDSEIYELTTVIGVKG